MTCCEVRLRFTIQCIKPCPHCRKKVRLSHKSETVAENGEKTATVALFCDSLTFVRQSHFSATRQSHFFATVWTGLNPSNHFCGAAITSHAIFLQKLI